MPFESDDAFASVELAVTGREVTTRDLARLVTMAGHLTPNAEFSMEVVEAGDTYLIRLAENVDTGVGT